MGHEANDRKDDEACKYTSGTVGAGHYDGIPMEERRKKKSQMDAIPHSYEGIIDVPCRDLH